MKEEDKQLLRQPRGGRCGVHGARFTGTALIISAAVVISAAALAAPSGNGAQTAQADTSTDQSYSTPSAPDASGAAQTPDQTAPSASAGSSQMAAPAASPSSASALNIDLGTVLPVTLNNDLSSATSKPGDTFTATVQEAPSGYPDLVGARVTGTVQSVQPASGPNPGSLSLAFTTLQTASGRSIPINGVPVRLSDPHVQQMGNGLYEVAAGYSPSPIIGGTTYTTGVSANNLGGVTGRDLMLASGDQIGVMLQQPVREFHRTARPTITIVPVPVKVSVPVALRPIRVRINGREQTFQQMRGPISVNGVAMLPVFQTAEKMGGSARFIPALHAITVTRGNHTVSARVNKSVALVDGTRWVDMGHPVQFFQVGYYAPLRFFELASARRSSWNKDKSSVNLKTQ